jgi:hypothetical protein
LQRFGNISPAATGVEAHQLLRDRCNDTCVRRSAPRIKLNCVQMGQDTVKAAVVNLYIQIIYGEHIDACRKLQGMKDEKGLRLK